MKNKATVRPLFRRFLAFLTAVCLLPLAGALADDFPGFWFLADFEKEYGNHFVPSDPQPGTYIIIIRKEVYDPVTRKDATQRQYSSSSGIGVSPVYNRPANSDNLVTAGKRAFPGMTLTDNPNQAAFMLTMSFKYSKGNNFSYKRTNGSRVSIPQYTGTLNATVRNLVTGEEASMAPSSRYATYANTSVSRASIEACINGAMYASVPSFDITAFGMPNSFYGYPEQETVVFGRYEQDNNPDNGPEPIEWIMLSSEGDEVLLISKYVLEKHPYHAEKAEVTWETADARAWLNEDFLKAAFTEEEQGALVPSHLQNNGRKGRGEGGNDTTDRVFLLSADETNELFRNNLERSCAPTEYAIEQGVFTSNDNCKWWLRTPGNDNKWAMTIEADGSLDSIGDILPGRRNGLRPAVRVSRQQLEALGLLR